MARLALEAAPEVAVPLRFLLTAPCWGMAAGLLLLAEADALLQSRWQPGRRRCSRCAARSISSTTA